MTDEDDDDDGNNTPIKVPQRGLIHGRPGLPYSLPIIGLGCSSFSTFFWSAKEKRRGWLQRREDCWTPETMDRQHARVQEWIDTIHYAIKECGITLLDTAPWYGHGTSEVVIGWALQELFNDEDSSSITRDDLIINTKVGRYEADPSKQFDFSKETTLESVQRSLERMKCDYINVLQLHDPEFAPNMEILMDEAIPAMILCRDKGLCRALGMTGYPMEVQYQILQRSLELHGPSVWDQSLVYSHFNLHDTSLFSRPLANSTVGGDESFADFCDYHEISIIAAAPLSMGLLTPGGPPAWHPASQALKDACREAASICASHNVDIATLALVMALSEPRIPCTLLGMKDVDQVKAAAKAAARFDAVNRGVTDQKEILKQVLTEEESTVMGILLDPTEGPFATAWASDEYHWDGVQQAIDFWKQVDGVEIDVWQEGRAAKQS